MIKVLMYRGVVGDGVRKVGEVMFYFVGDKMLLFKDYKQESDRVSFVFQNDFFDYSENGELEQSKFAIREIVESCCD